MNDPSLETAAFKQPLTIPPATNNNIEPLSELPNIDLAVSKVQPGDSVSPQQVELEILLAMKIEDGQSFEKAVQATMVCSGNEFLFSFPSERFPITCTDVACIRLLQDHGSTCIYLYRENAGGSIQIAEPAMLNGEFEQFAQSFIAVMEQMRGLFSSRQTH